MSEAKLRVLVLNERDLEHPRAGGAEIHVSRIFSRLAERGFDVRQLSAGFRGGASETRQAGVLVERRGPLAAYYATLPARVRALRSEVDVVVECLNKLPFFAPRYAGRPVLALCHHLFGEVAYEQVAWPIATAVVWAERALPRAYRDVDFVAISESTREDLVARGLSPDRIRTSPPGIDPPDPELRRSLDPEASRPPRIAYLGRLEAYKRVDLFLRAGAELAGRWPDLELLVIGRGEESASLEALAASLGLGDRTRFTGFVEDAERDRLLASARACVFPSPKEGWGLTVIEANALATPVVACDAPGLRDSVRDGETGRLVQEASPAAFARALEPLLVEDAATFAMRRAALAWSDRFDWERAADDLEAALEACVEGASA